MKKLVRYDQRKPSKSHRCLAVTFSHRFTDNDIVWSSILRLLDISLRLYFNCALCKYLFNNNNIYIYISFWLELIPPRGGINHLDLFSPLLSVTSMFFLFNRRDFMSLIMS